jgi:hypothetical protein
VVKTCTKCHRSDVTFGRFKYGKDGLKPCCILCNRAAARLWCASHPQQVRDRTKRWQQTNKKRYNAYLVEKRRNDPNAKLRHILRTRLLRAVAGNARAGSAVADLGCSIPELKQYIERQFRPGMTWANHGEWHIDHKRALAGFDLTDRGQFLQACHYTNLQPLWAFENLQKSDK